MEEKILITKEHLVQDLTNLRVKKGDLLNVKCSLRSIGKIEGGASTLIEALLDVVGHEGTIVTDSFINVYKKNVAKKMEVSYELSSSYAGALANEMINHKDAVRSKHPIQKFVAIGKLAEELMLNHTKDSYAYDVLKRMTGIGGKNLKIGNDDKVVGVGTTHVAIGELGLRQLRPNVGRYFINENNKEFYPINWAGICPDGLIKFIPFYDEYGAIISEGKVGNANSKITDMQKALNVEIAILSKDPSFFMCGNEDCLSCQLTWEFNKKNKYLLLFKYLFQGKLITSAKVLKFIFTKHTFKPDK